MRIDNLSDKSISYKVSDTRHILCAFGIAACLFSSMKECLLVQWASQWHCQQEAKASAANGDKDWLFLR